MNQQRLNNGSDYLNILPIEILFKIIKLTDLNTLLTLLRINKSFRKKIKSSSYYKSVKSSLFNTVKKLNISRRSIVGAIIHDLSFNSKSQILDPATFDQRVKIGGKKHLKLINDGKLLDIFEIKNQLDKGNRFVIIDFALKLNGKIFRNVYRTARIVTIDGKFIYYDSSPNQTFEINEVELFLFKKLIGKSKIKNHYLTSLWNVEF